jgi:hypothetical protein
LLLIEIIHIYKQAHFFNPPKVFGGLNNGGLNPRYIKTQKLQKYKKTKYKTYLKRGLNKKKEGDYMEAV